jgi:hypothetical protein
VGVVSARRKRTYELYGSRRSGDLTVYSEHYHAGTHRWVHRVRAVSVKQAYVLAAQEAWAADEQSVGLLEVETDWWHRRSSPEPGDRELAPYLQAGTGTGTERVTCSCGATYLRGRPDWTTCLRCEITEGRVNGER